MSAWHEPPKITLPQQLIQTPCCAVQFKSSCTRAAMERMCATPPSPPLCCRWQTCSTGRVSAGRAAMQHIMAADAG